MEVGVKAVEEIKAYNPTLLIGVIAHPKFHVIMKFPHIISSVTNRPVMGWGETEEEAATRALSQIRPRC
jgi:hypothetical protein